MKKVLGLALAAVALWTLPASKASADFSTGPYDVTGWISWSDTIVGGPNDGILINLPVGSTVTGIDFSEINYQSVYPSWQSEARIGLFELDGVGGYTDYSETSFSPPVNNWGTYGPYTGSFGTGGSLPFVVDNGTGDLWLTVFESFNDGGDSFPDTIYVGGTVTVYYIPEPSAAALGLVGLGLTCWRRRRA